MADSIPTVGTSLPIIIGKREQTQTGELASEHELDAEPGTVEQNQNANLINLKAQRSSEDQSAIIPIMAIKVQPNDHEIQHNRQRIRKAPEQQQPTRERVRNASTTNSRLLIEVRYHMM